ncbi:hypothetical protein DFJ74DRAFT_688157 [Hyaloraphidium curvatum]|nr:hypothetical protein DFJ74DRAFT_688157 [Hyaloraphidium curvatum]
MARVYSHEELYKLVKTWIKEEEGWSLQNQRDGLVMHSKPMNGLAIACYRIADTGLEKGKDAKKMVDHMVGMREKEWKELDASTKVWKLLDSNAERDVIYQCNSLPWPLSSREFLVERRRFSDDEGEFLVVLDAEGVSGAPSEKGAVKARSVINVNAFLKVDGGTKIFRFVQIDPAGSIPSFVVNAKASDFMDDVLKFKKFPG